MAAAKSSRSVLSRSAGKLVTVLGMGPGALDGQTLAFTATFAGGTTTARLDVSAALAAKERRSRFHPKQQRFRSRLRPFRRACFEVRGGVDLLARLGWRTP
jgi:hypothetical protein